MKIRGNIEFRFPLHDVLMCCCRSTHGIVGVYLDLKARSPYTAEFVNYVIST